MPGEGPLGFLGGYLVDALAKDFRSPIICFFLKKKRLPEWLGEGRMVKNTDLERKCFVFLEFDEKDRVLVMYTHQFTLSISFFPREKKKRQYRMKYRMKNKKAHSRPLVKLDFRSGMLFLSTQMSDVRM